MSQSLFESLSPKRPSELPQLAGSMLSTVITARELLAKACNSNMSANVAPAVTAYATEAPQQMVQGNLGHSVVGYAGGVPKAANPAEAFNYYNPTAQATVAQQMVAAPELVRQYLQPVPQPTETITLRDDAPYQEPAYLAEASQETIAPVVPIATGGQTTDAIRAAVYNAYQEAA